MPGTGADSPIWIIPDSITRDFHKQNSTLGLSVILNDPIVLPASLTLEWEPEDAIVGDPLQINLTQAKTPVAPQPVTTVHNGDLPIKFTGTLTDAKGVVFTQIRYLIVKG